MYMNFLSSFQITITMMDKAKLVQSNDRHVNVSQKDKIPRKAVFCEMVLIITIQYLLPRFIFTLLNLSYLTKNPKI